MGVVEWRHCDLQRVDCEMFRLLVSTLESAFWERLERSEIQRCDAVNAGVDQSDRAAQWEAWAGQKQSFEENSTLC